MVGAAKASRHFLPTINFSQLVQCLVRARIWQRVCHLTFSCEQWIGPVSHPRTHSQTEIPVITFLVLSCTLLESTQLLWQSSRFLLVPQESYVHGLGHESLFRKTQLSFCGMSKPYGSAIPHTVCMKRLNTF